MLKIDGASVIFKPAQISLGLNVGEIVGFEVGNFVGIFVGEIDGCFVGCFVGRFVGILVGFSVGLLVGQDKLWKVAPRQGLEVQKRYRYRSFG